jgi:hypothetical protein
LFGWLGFLDTVSLSFLRFRNVGPKKSISATVTLTPRLPGKRQIIAGFDSKQITDVVGYHDLLIKKGKAPETDPEEVIVEETDPEEEELVYNPRTDGMSPNIWKIPRKNIE